MQEPKFKAGDPVQYEGSGDVMHVVFNALAPIELSGGGPLFRTRRDEWCYLVDYGAPVARLVPEGRLTRAEVWEPCPGLHRHADSKATWPDRTFERLVGSSPT